MAGVRNEPRANGKYPGWYTDARGRQKHFTGTRSQAETLRMARRLEDDHRQVRLGYRPAPASHDKHRTRPFAEAAAEYRAWGEDQGGRGGRPWSETHAAKIRTKLAFWRDKLGLATLADLDGILPRAEAALREIAASGRAGRTVENCVEPLRGFCRWAIQRGYLADDPLKGRKRYDVTPRSTRRALTAEEVKALLNVADGWRRLVYEVALCSGLRANELRSLCRADLDTQRGGLILHGEWTKNRKDGFQPLPGVLIKRLANFAASGEADDLYRRYPPRRRETPSDPLVYVPDNTSRMFEADRKAAGIKKEAFGGKADFHGLRVCYVTGLLESGANVKEAQSLARHSTPQLTMNVYGRTRETRLSAIAERIGETVLPAAEHAHILARKAAGAEGLDVNAITPSGKGNGRWWRRGESNPRPVAFQPGLLRV